MLVNRVREPSRMIDSCFTGYRQAMKSLIVAWNALYTLFGLGALGRCPKCREGRMFASHFSIHQRCPVCNVRFQPYEGDVLGVYATCYFLTVIPAALLCVALYVFSSPPLWMLVAVFGAVSSVILLAFYPAMKGIWIAFVYLLTGLRPRL